MNRTKINYMICLSIITLVVGFQNCGKSQFQSGLADQEVAMASTAAENLGQQSSFTYSDINQTQFTKIDTVSVDQYSDQVYFTSDNKLYKMNKDKSVTFIYGSNSPDITYNNIEVSPNDQSVYSIEYNKNAFNGVKKITSQGVSSYVLNKDAFKDGHYITHQTSTGSSTTTSWVDIGTNIQIMLVRVDKTPLLRITNSSNQYFWINLLDGSVIDTFAMTCMRTGQCENSANLISLALSAQTIPLNWDDSAGNIYRANGCQIEVTYKSNSKTELLGQSCTTH